MGIGASFACQLVKSWDLLDPDCCMDKKIRLELLYKDKLVLSFLLLPFMPLPGLASTFLGIKIFSVYSSLCFLVVVILEFFVVTTFLPIIRDRKLCIASRRLYIRQTIPKSFLTFIGSKVKFLLLFIFAAGAIWGCLWLTLSVRLQDFIPDDSSFKDYYRVRGDYFSDLEHRIQIWSEGKLEYWKPDVRNRTEYMLRSFESLSYSHGSKLTESWIRVLFHLQRHNRTKGLFQDLDLDNRTDFMRGVNIMLKFPLTRRYKKDIVFSENGTQIVASRFAIQCINVVGREKEMMNSYRRLADVFNVKIFSPAFIYYDQDAKWLIAWALGVTALGILIGPSSAINVGIVVISLMGYLTFWHVPLHAFSLSYVFASIILAVLPTQASIILLPAAAFFLFSGSPIWVSFSKIVILASLANCFYRWCVNH